jgi:hypothetical protein
MKPYVKFGRRNAYVQSEDMKVTDHLVDLGVDGTIILKQVLKKLCVSVGWIYLDQN